MRAPAFWRHADWRAEVLAPVAAVYGAATTARRRIMRPEQAALPVLCVGNLVAGGAGKTPTAMALARRLRARGRTPHLISRGYGGRERGPLAVDPARHDARRVGDEALLLARVAPTWVARDRTVAAAAAHAAGADVVVLDDGYQNPALAKTVSLVVVDGSYGFGNGRLLPAGPLRERVGAGLARADAVVLIGHDRAGVRRRVPAGCPVIEAALVPAEGWDAVAGESVVAFAGIGRPEKFFEMLESLSCTLLATRAFADHHRFRAHEILALADEAARRGAVLATTPRTRCVCLKACAPCQRSLRSHWNGVTAARRRMQSSTDFDGWPRYSTRVESLSTAGAASRGYIIGSCYAASYQAAHTAWESSMSVSLRLPSVFVHDAIPLVRYPLRRRRVRRRLLAKRD